MRVPFFKGKEVKLILKIVPNLKPINYENGDIIYLESDFAEEGLFFLINNFFFK